nr:hypothetical protein [Anaerolineae bacterium]
MPLLLILVIILPLAGAGGTLGLSLVPRVRSYTRYIALAAAGFTAILILRFMWMEPVTVIPALWQPSLLFGATLTLHTDVTMQPLALTLALITCSAILVELSRTEGSHPRLLATLLALLAAGLAALWAANLLTMIISWAVYDLLQAAGRIAAGGSGRTATRGLIFGNLATLFLWAGALLPDDGAGSELWSLMTCSSAQLTLWAVAGILRLWVYPLHLAAPDDLDAAPSLATPLLLGPIVGWGLWLRLAAANGGPIPGGAWVLPLAAVTLAVGGFLAWSCASHRRMLPWVGMGMTGAVLLAAGLAGKSGATVIAAGSVASFSILSGSNLFASLCACGIDALQAGHPNGFTRQGIRCRNRPNRSVVKEYTNHSTGAWLKQQVQRLGWGGTFFVGYLFLVASLMRWLLTSPLQRLEWGGAFFVGHLFLVASLVRGLLTSPSPPLPNRRWLLMARGVGLGLPALLLIVIGLHPPLPIRSVPTPTPGPLFTVPGVASWLLWAISLAGGTVLAWQEGSLRPKIELLLSAAHDLLRLEWLYGAVVGALDRGLSALRAADEIVGGAGALLWSWLLFLLLILVWSSK